MGDAKEITEKRQESGFRLILGLPDELAMECMIRVPFQFHSAMKSVCAGWRKLLSDPLFYQQRRKSGKAENLLFLVQPLTPSPATTGECDGEIMTDTSVKKQQGDDQLNQRVHTTPRYGLGAYNASFGTWHRIKLAEGGGGADSVSIPLFCECVTISGKIMLVGGWDPETLQPVSDVYILDLVGGNGRSWRRGAPMAAARSFFACAALGTSKVLVAGGHDERKNALKTAEVYDVERDEWEPLPPMEEARDEAVAVALDNDQGLCVVSGYSTERQGRFRSDAEIYDPTTKSWSKIDNVWPFPDQSPRGRTTTVSAAIGGGGKACRLLCFSSGDRQIQHRRIVDGSERKWKMVADTVKIPKFTAAFFATIVGDLCVGGGEHVVVIGGEGDCEGKGGLMIKRGCVEGDGKWRRFNTPLGFSSFPFSAASIAM